MMLGNRRLVGRKRCVYQSIIRMVSFGCCSIQMYGFGLHGLVRMLESFWIKDAPIGTIKNIMNFWMLGDRLYWARTLSMQRSVSLPLQRVMKRKIQFF